jgi:hypothetical protein
VPGHIVCSHGVAALPQELQVRVWSAVLNCSAFDDDRRGEHDAGVFGIDGLSEHIAWRIRYYADETCGAASEDPADPSRSFRVLAIRLASEEGTYSGAMALIPALRTPGLIMACRLASLCS